MQSRELIRPNAGDNRVQYGQFGPKIPILLPGPTAQVDMSDMSQVLPYHLSTRKHRPRLGR